MSSKLKLFCLVTMGISIGLLGNFVGWSLLVTVALSALLAFLFSMFFPPSRAKNSKNRVFIFEMSEETYWRMHKLQQREECKHMGHLICRSLAILDFIHRIGDEGFTEILAKNPETFEQKELYF